MGKMMRIDKLLAHMGRGSRSDIRKWAKTGRISVNGKSVKDSGHQVDPEQDVVRLDDEIVLYREYIYVMMNKPQGVISATEDTRERTVLDLLPAALRHFEPFPVGRLDKDTEGLLLISNDGQLAHQLLSPKKHVPKTYFAHVAGQVTAEDGASFAAGVTLDDGYVTAPAQLNILGHRMDEEGNVLSDIELTITEGKFHQVKRMSAAVGKKVVYLKRLSMGTLELDLQLKTGQWRECSPEEIERLRSGHNEG
jgi:16S rRNA pseudouridine516 synthase